MPPRVGECGKREVDAAQHNFPLQLFGGKDHKIIEWTLTLVGSDTRMDYAPFLLLQCWHGPNAQTFVGTVTAPNQQSYPNIHNTLRYLTQTSVGGGGCFHSPSFEKHISVWYPCSEVFVVLIRSSQVDSKLSCNT